MTPSNTRIPTAWASVAPGAIDLSPVITLTLAGYLLYGIQSDRFLPFQKEFFGLIVLLVGILALFGLASRRLPEGLPMRLAAVLLLYLLFTLPIALQENLYPRWIAGDVAIVAAPFLFYLAGHAMPALYGRWQVAFLLLVLFVCALGASLFPDVTDANRFEPPMVLLIAAVWWSLFNTRKGPWIVFWALATLILLALAWFSTVRNAPVVWLLIGALVLVTRRSTLAVLVATAVTGLLLLIALSQDATLDLLQSSRFASISLDNLLTEGFLYLRLVEFSDVWQTFSAASNGLQWLFGFGYGATYNMNEVYSVLTIERIDAGRLSAEGLAHVIHFGPLRILFRYGLLGLAIVLAIIVVILKDVFALLRYGPPRHASPLFPVFLLAVYAYLFRFLLHPIGNEIIFAYALGGYFALRGSFVQAEAQERLARA